MTREAKIISTFAIATVLMSILILISGCGGTGSSGGSGLPGGGGSGGGTGGNASMSIQQFTITPTNVTTGQTVTVHWKVAYSTPTTGYTAEFHVNSQPSLISGCTGCTQVFNANCDSGATPWGTDATVSGSYLKDAGGQEYIVFASPHGSRYLNTFNLSQPVYAMLHACTYDGNLNQVCDTKYVQVTFAP